MWMIFLTLIVAPPAEEFLPPKSMLETAERLLSNERDPAKRLEILFRWIKIKEDYQQTLRAQLKDPQDPQSLQIFKDYKNEIIDRLSKELKSFESSPLVLDRVHRELAFRLLEAKRHPEAQKHFESLKVRTADDELSYGDALLGNKLTELALQAYGTASKEPKLLTVASYRRGWAYLQLNDFFNALKEFNIALEDNPHTPARMREEAYKDRLRPYVETFSKSDFEKSDAGELKALAIRVQSPEQKKSDSIPLFSDGLRTLVENFNAKSDIRRAQQVFGFLIEALPQGDSEALNVLLMSAPLWLRVHRGRLEHDDVSRILKSLPEKEVPVALSSGIQSELNNTAGFYEAMVEDSKDADPAREEKLKNLLLLTYQKYFQLFPIDPEADPLRINYSRLLLKGGDAEACLNVLNKRSKKDAEVEKIASGLEAQCDLKYLDQLYAKPHTDFFYAKLNRDLVSEKIYKRPEIGLPEEPTFKSMVGMLMGALKKNPKAEVLRGTLIHLRDQYPYSKEDAVFAEIKVVSAELDFEDVMASSLEQNPKATAFYQIYERAPLGAGVTLKSIKNSILLSTEKQALSRCEKFQAVYPEEFGKTSDIYQRCLGLSERHLQLEKELAYWKLYEKTWTESEKMRVALIELGLGREQVGKARLLSLKTAAAKKTFDFWYGIAPEKPALHSKISELENESQRFVKGLKQVAFAKIGKIVPGMINEFKSLDREWVKASKFDSSSLALAKILDQRAFISIRMRDWMRSLPEPSGLSSDELKQYREQAKAVIKPWDDLAQQAMKECGETAYALAPEFEKSANCPETTLEATYNDFMRKWEETRQPNESTTPWAEATASEQEKLFRIMLEAGLSETDKLRAKYFLVRAYDLAKENRDKGRIQLAFAKIVDKERFWRTAAELDGNLIDPILWLKTRSNGNPFYEKLYSDQLDLIKRQKKFSGSRATTEVTDASRF